ncbi:CoA transferase [Pseudonocardia sp. RS11V-5]|uniref:CaiB/BaiF CoA transferase family protein n=1 Tax=Pseudonocardia terrae TaxID=2905831 RepID=UPI001E5BB1F4|nr:CoA transferase [Pseudonocardia terrae]MCE3554728.1 CoA transferase [Pseudonocardia terrae]
MSAPLPSHDLDPAPTGRPGLLSGIRVLDLTTSVAAPYATMLLGDLGAEILKVERPGSGDDSRAWGPPFLDGESLWFLSVNRSKRSVTLDITSAPGQEVLHRLVAACDVVVVNMTGRVQRKLGLDRETLTAVRPDLVHVSISGYGLTGEHAGLSGYDLIAEGYSGIMDVTGAADSPPQKIGAPAADVLAGMDAALGAVSALFDRARTGRGHGVDVSLVESMTRMLAPRLVSYLGSGEVPRRSGGTDSVIAIYQAFETADRPLTLGLGNDGIWARFWASVGDPEFGADPRFRSNSDRREHRAEIVERIAGILRGQSRVHWLGVLAEARVPAGPINSLDEVAADPHLRGRGLFYGIERNGAVIPQVGLGIRFDDAAAGPSAVPPRLGADTDDVLREIAGLSAEEIERLRDKDVV